MEDVKTEVKQENQIPSPVNAKKDPFALFGKIILILIILGILIGGGYYLGTSANKKQEVATNSTISPSPSSQVTTVIVHDTPSPTVMTPTTKTITAGPAAGTSFSAYSIEIPTGWTDTNEKTAVSDKLTITKDKYVLTIYQAPFGGGGCLYPGDAPSEMAQSFTDFAGITGSTYQFRRSWNKTGNPAGTISYTVCQKGADNSYGSPTAYGAVSVKSPEVVDDKIMADIDFMISKLVKK